MALGVGILGLGRSGWDIHLPALRAMPDQFRVVAVTDADPQRRAEAQAALPDCTVYAEASGVLADPTVDVVVICTPTHTHMDLACQAMRAGKHAVVEKPFACSVAEADAMMAAARESGRLLAAFHNRRYDPDLLQVRQILASGILGPIHLLKMARHSYYRRHDWQTLRKYGGGQLSNWGSHCLDQLLCLVGEQEVIDIFADLRQTVSAGDAEDHVKVVLRLADGMVADVEITSACAYPQAEWLIMGKYGTLTSTSSAMEWRYCDPAALPPVQAAEGPAAGRQYVVPEEIPWQHGSLTFDRMDGRSMVLWYQDFYRALTEGAPVPGSPESVRRLLTLIDRVRSVTQ